MSEMRIPNAPLFKCPVSDGAAQPRLIWNREEKSWFMFFQPRNTRAPLKGDDALSFCFGSGIGIASSKDNGQNWIYRGLAEGLNFEPGHNSWAFPELTWFNGEYHLFCQYVQGYPTTFQGPSQIVHYTSNKLWNWKFDKSIKPDDHRKNSMAVYQLPGGKWRWYYTDNKVLSLLESDKLYDWIYIGKNVDELHNSTNVFKLGSYFWMTIDTYKGYAVYRSEDCDNWSSQDYKILSQPGSRRDDGSGAHHSGVVALEDKVYFFYYTDPERNPGFSADQNHGETHLRRSVLQVALITERDGRIYCDRNEPFDFFLPNQE